MNLNLRDDSIRRQAGLAMPNASTGTHPDKFRESYHRPYEDTVQLIVETVKSASTPLSRADIAKALQRKKTRYVAVIIEHLVSLDVLQKHKIPYRQVGKYLYS